MTDTMDKVIFFFCVFCWIMQILQISDALIRGSSDVLKVQMGEDITLNCSMRSRYEVSWYHFNSDQIDLLFSVKKDKTGKYLLMNYETNSTRLKITEDTRITRVSLVISGVKESDLGFYLCGTKSDTPEMHFEKPIRLEIEGLVPKEEVDITDEVTSKERMLMFGGVGLAVFVFFLTTVIAGGIIYHRGWQKGWKEAKHGALNN